MRLVSWFDAPNRNSGTWATDMDVVECLKYLATNIGTNIAIVWTLDISEAEFRRWKLEGHPSITKQEVRLKRAIG